ncbi:HEAT repeat-containing protein 1 [Galleria mellonella]|uniref:HEAT repeat-containing protein 1 n=1 Tax=Galleria mellonella TaxID=7137 RepID=A0ABM3N303_GALME|nr:HEAT repeat-containing protein 1 [Galleria mellonella]XP_052757838.1 HEAT repeat-containing protein 1 [Galleria mellonella]
MTTTSLGEQLKKLSAPQSSIYEDHDKRVSLLFNPKEAASKDRDTFYEIGISGLKELITLYEGFRVFEDTLFSLSSKDFERAMETKQVNEHLDQTIEKFLMQLSPYFLLQSAHKALEWLVNRYHIHQYNQDAIMALILPYHSSMIFVRFVQIMNIKSTSNRWNWLSSIQKKGVPLANQIWYNQCVSNAASLKFLVNSTLKYIAEFGERSSHLNTVFAFLCQTAVGVMETSKKVNEAVVNALLPVIVKGIESSIVDFRAAVHIILGFMFTKVSLKKETLNEIVDKLLTTEFDLTYDATILLTMMFTHQTHMTMIPESILSNISVETMNTLCQHIKNSVEKKQNIVPFSLAFLSSVLRVVQRDMEEFKKFYQLPEIFLDEVNLRNQQPEKIVRCVLNAYQPRKNKPVVVENESDVEIIEEDDLNIKILEWYSFLLKSIERKYPEAFDKVVQEIMSSESKINKKRRVQLSKVLTFKPAVAHEIGGSYLFENLNHVNPQLRVEAVKYIEKEFESLKNENIAFVKDSIVNRFNDDNPEVVAAALEISNDYIKDILNEEDVVNVFINIMSRGSPEWKSIIRKAVFKFCSLDLLPVKQETVLAMLPYLFPDDVESAKITWQIIISTWGKKLKLVQNIQGVTKESKDNCKVLNQVVFKALFEKKSINFDDILNHNHVNVKNTLDVYMFLLLKTCSLNKTTAEEMIIMLNMLLETVENKVIISSTEDQVFSSKITSEFIKHCREDRIIFQVIEYIFSSIIKNINVKDITKPWCNVCETPAIILIRRLYEICITGCGIPTYERNYVNLLKELLSKICNNSREKFEFIANFACGHILYATDPKDVVGPELQIRSIKLLNNFIAAQENMDWIYDSDVVTLMILFNLNNPLVAIRNCTIDLIETLLKDNPDNTLIYVKLLIEVMTHKEETLLDHEQISQVLKIILSQQSPAMKIFKKKCLIKFANILIGETPAHIKANLLKLLSSLDDASTFSYIVPSLKILENVLPSEKMDTKLRFNIYESNLFKSVYNNINESTVSTFSKKDVWNYIELGLKEYRECVLLEEQTYTSPCVLILKQIDENVFKKIPNEKVQDIIYMITSAGAFSNNPTIASVASRVMKKVHLQFADFKHILEGMLSVEDPAANMPKKKKSSVSMLSYQLTETDEWRLGVTFLEYVQSKKKMTVDNSFVNILFQILNKCLRFEEQSYVEYTKQLILSSLWYYCTKFVDDKDEDEMKSLKSIFKVELIVMCIRGTQNPQTHHHALILLSHAAYILPDQVLHHTMEIFTFMGSSVLRHDDAYSFQIIVKIIENLIPILVKLDKKIEEHTEKELQQLQDRVVPVLRIFADVVLHVPEHRRLPLYTKLLETVGASNFLWVFLALLLETHVAHFNDEKKKDRNQNRLLANQEAPANRLDFGQNVLLEFPPEICLENFLKLIVYLKSLPLQKDENSMDTDVDPTDIFSVNGHTPVQLRQYKYVIITFMNNCLSSSRFIDHCGAASSYEIMESHYKGFIVNVLTFIQSISKLGDEKTAKYWRVMLHHSYDLLDHANSLLSPPMFLSVTRGLLKHTLQAVRRKAMELLNSKIQFNPEMFENVNRNLLYSLLPALLDIVKTIESKDETLNEVAAQELELNQQTALLSLKLLTRLLASKNPEPFKPVLEIVTEYTCNSSISGNVMASIVLCLAELCSNLKAHVLVGLRKFMPALLKVLKKQRKAETPELVLLSTITAITKILESLPLFLSPYMQKILYEYSILSAKWQAHDQECNKVSAIVTKLATIKKKIAASIPPRVLIPVTNETHQLLLGKENYDAIGPLMSVLAESFSNVTTADFTALQQDLTTFFLSALQLRSDAVKKEIDDAIINSAEDEVINALVRLVLKLSETSFRPFYFKIYDWAIRSNVEGHKDRVITFYRLSAAIANQLKGLFVLFAGHFMKNAAELLDSCNNSKTEDLYFDSEDKCVVLVRCIVKTLHMVFLYDSQNFLNKERFETLMQPVVDQLENTVCGISNLKQRAEECLIPCISQFAVATADDSLWKLLNYQILLKTRHNDAEIRLVALDCLVAMATQLGSSWLPLLAESVPFLAELLEDGDSRIESSTKDAIRKLEQILGEPLEKYF